MASVLFVHSVLAVGCVAGVAFRDDAGGASPVDGAADADTGAVLADVAPRGDAAPGEGLPCDVAHVLATYCTSCHRAGSTAAPMPLETYADLVAPSPADPAQTLAQRSVARMADTARPMPPGGGPGVAAADQTAFSAWVSMGSPRASCTTPPPADPFAVAAQCTSTLTWFFGNSGGSLMNPGQPCVACHRTRGRTLFSVAGTVYPTGHEPDNCVGRSDAAISIEVTDARGTVFHYTPGLTGNFSGTDAIVSPYTARVLSMGRVRAMVAPQTDGDCNACHTQSGAHGAPGRVLMP